MRRLAIAFIVSALGAASAQAQSTLLQAGTFSSGRAPMYVTQGSSPAQAVVQDSGPAGGGGVGLGLRELNLTARGTGTAPYAGQGTGPNGEIMCLFDAATTNSTGYHTLCLSPNAQGGGLLSYQAMGGASALPFNFMVNGTVYEFPFSTGGVVGPSSSTINNAACWNNTSGTLLKDCGPFVTVAGNNTWSGTNNFTGTFQIGGVTQTFPASGNILGASDIQTITNKSIAASQINSGTLPATVMPALTGNVTSSAGSVATTIANGVVTNAMMATATQNTVKGAATSTAIADLTMPSCSTGSSALQWTTNTGFNCATLTANTAGFGIDLTGGVFSISSSAPPYGYSFPINLGLTASVNASALTINVTTAAGSTPTSSSPVLVPFRSTTLATGTLNWAAITSANSITIPSAATLGTTNNVAFRIWLFMTYNAGVPQLGVAVCSTSLRIYPCTAWEFTRQTSTAITGFSTSAGVLYAPAGVSNDSVRIIGYAEYSSGLATAGSWASTPTTLQVLSPGMKKPGEMIQKISPAPISTTTVLTSAVDTQTAITASITPSSTMNLIKVTAAVAVASNNLSGSAMILSRGTGPTLIGPRLLTGGPSVPPNTASVTLFTLDFPATVSSQAYYVYGQSSGSSTTTVNTSPGTSTIDLEEIMGFDLREPANDNINPGVYSLTG